MTARKTADAVGEAPETVTHTPHTHTEDVRELHLFEKLGIVQRHMAEIAWKKTLAAEDAYRAQGEKSKSFRTVPIDDMRSGLAQACAKARLIHYLEVTEMEVSAEKGYLWYHRGRGVMTYIDIDHPDERMAFPTTGESQDSGDKGRAKFESALIKSHIKSVWDVGEGNIDDPDSVTNDRILEDLERKEEAYARIEERRARRQEAVRNDPFYSKPAPAEPSADVIALRKRMGAFSMMGEPFATIIQGHKAVKPFAEWDRAMLESVLAECEAAKGAGQ